MLGKLTRRRLTAGGRVRKERQRPRRLAFEFLEARRLLAFEVAAINPPDGTRTQVSPAEITVDFNAPIRLSSLNAFDLTISGVPAVAVTLADADTAVFTPAYSLPAGTYTLRLAAGCITSVQGIPLGAFWSTLVIDRTGPRLTASSVAEDGVAAAGSWTYTARFDEELAAAGLDAADVSLQGQHSGLHAPTSFQYAAATSTLTLQFEHLPDDAYTLTLISAATGFCDRAGNLLDGEALAFPLPPARSGDGTPGGDFVLHFAADLGTVAVPLPLAAQAPAGSLVYQGDVAGAVTPSGNWDSYTLALDAGQTLSVALAAAADVTATIQVLAPDDSSLGTATAAVAGQAVALQTVPVATAGTYTLRVGGTTPTSLAASVTYLAQVFLNQALEQEAMGGPTNDTYDTAQGLAAAFSDLPGAAAQRAAVGGRHGLTGTGWYAASVVSYAFEDIGSTGTSVLVGSDDGVVELTDAALRDFQFPFYGTVYANLFVSSNGLITFGSGNNAHANTDLAGSPTQPAIAVLWDDLYVGSTGPNSSLRWRVLGSGSSERLIIQWNNVRYYDGSGSDPITFQVVLSEADGSIQLNYRDISDTTSYRNDGASASVGVKAAGAQGWDRLLLAHDSGPNEFVATGISTRIVYQPAVSPDDWFAFPLTAGQAATLALTGEAALGLYDASQTRLASGVAAANVGQAIPNFVAPAAGTYYARVTGSQVDYRLVITRGAAFDTEPNDAADQARDLSGSGVVLGHVRGDLPGTPPGDDDWYAWQVQQGDALTFTTWTPLEGPGEPVNPLDAALEVYAPGNLAVPAASATGVGNALLQHTAAETGLYRVRVFGQAGTAGEYVLGVQGGTPTNPAPGVTDANPAADAQLPGFPVTYRLDFSESLLLATLQPGDLIVGGRPAMALTILDGDTVAFTVDPAANVGDGVYAVSLAAGAVSDLQGRGNLAFDTAFILDTRGPVITATAWNGADLPAGRLLPAGPLTVDLTFSEPLRSSASAAEGPGAPGTDDVELVEQLTGEVFHPQVVGTSGNTFTAQFTTELPEGFYTLRLVSGAGAFADEAGNTLDGEPLGPGLDGTPTGDGTPGGDFTSSFQVDRNVPVVVPLVRLAPEGSLMSASLSGAGLVNGAGDEDEFSIFLKGGQTIAAIATPADPAAVLTLTFNGGAPLTGAAGQPVVLPLQRIAGGGTPILRVAGNARTPFTLDIYGNAASEAPAGDSDAAHPLLLDGSYLDLADGPRPGGRWAGAGTSSPVFSPTIAYRADMSTNPGWTLDGQWAYGPPTGAAGDPLAGASGANVIGYNLDGAYDSDLPPTSAVTPAFSTVGSPRVTLDFQRWLGVEDADYDHAAVEVSRDGFSWSTVWSHTGDSFQDTAWRPQSFDISAVAGNQPAVFLRWTMGPTDGLFTYGGWNIDDVVVTGYVPTADVDAYSLDLSGQVGRPIDVLLAGQDGVDFSSQVLELLAPDGTVLATAIADPPGGNDGNYDLGILDWVVPDLGNRVFTLRLTSIAVGDYGLAVTDGLTFDSEPNDALADPLRGLDLTRMALGYLDVGEPAPPQANGDLYRVDLEAGETVQLRTATPWDDAHSQPANRLDPAVALLGPSGQLLAGDANSRDGKNADLTFTAAAAGTYLVQVLPESGRGEYQLFVRTVQLIVTSLRPTASGFVARFSAGFALAGLNLYDGAGGNSGPADVVLEDSAGRTVAGSLVVTDGGQSLEFVKTGGILPPDTYTVTLTSGPAAFRDLDGQPLDGNDDGVTGDDYRTAFAVSEPPAGTVTIGLPDLARGAGQPVDVPSLAAGWPIRLAQAAGVTSLAVDVRYDPALLTISGGSAATGLPTGWNVAVDTSTAGVAKVTAAGAAPLAGNQLDVARLTAGVPGSAPYGASQAIRLENVVVNGGAITGIGDVAVHKAACLGDGDGSGIHSAADAFLVVQAALGLASGFAAHAWTDPRIVGDADGSGMLSAADAFLIVQEGLGLDEPFVPDNPHLPVVAAAGGVDPQFRIDAAIPAGAGGTVTVPVKLAIEPDATNVGGIDFAVYFDPVALTLDVPAGVWPGADTAAGWGVSARLVAPGHVRLGMVGAGGAPLKPGLREIAQLQFHVTSHVASSRPDALPLAERAAYAVLDIEPGDPRAGGYVWTAVDGGVAMAALPAERRAEIRGSCLELHEHVFRELAAELSWLDELLPD